MKIFAKYFALFLVMSFFMTPILWTAITAIKPTELISANPIVWSFRPTWEHFRLIFAEDNIAAPLLNSTIVASFSTLAVLAIAAPAERLTHPGMVVGREDVLVAGLFVLDAVMERFGVSELLSSENDILDGITQSLLRG